MRCLGRTETDRNNTNEPWSSKQTLTEQNKTTLRSERGGVPEKRKERTNNLQKRSRHEPALLEMPQKKTRNSGDWVLLLLLHPLEAVRRVQEISDDLDWRRMLADRVTYSTWKTERNLQRASRPRKR